MMPLRADHALIAGDVLSFTCTVTGGITGVPIKATIKRLIDDDDAAALAEVDTVDGGVVVLSDTQLRVTFGSDVTRGLPIADLWHDVEADPSSTESYTVAEGAIAVRRRVTRAHLEGELLVIDGEPITVDGLPIAV